MPSLCLQLGEWSVWRAAPDCVCAVRALPPRPPLGEGVGREEGGGGGGGGVPGAPIPPGCKPACLLAVWQEGRQCLWV